MARPARILIVDEDPAARATLARLLRGHDLFEVDDAAAALAACAAGAVEVIVIDVRPWPLDGLELVAELQRRRLAVPVVVVTTGEPAAIGQMIEDLALANVVAVVAKPASAATMAAAVARAYDPDAAIATAPRLAPVAGPPGRSRIVEPDPGA